MQINRWFSVGLSLMLAGCGSICYRGDKIASDSSCAMPCKFRLSEYTFKTVPELDRTGNSLDAETATFYNTSVPAATGNASRMKVEDALVKNHPDTFSKETSALPISVAVIFTENRSDVPNTFASIITSCVGILPFKVADSHDVCEVRVTLNRETTNATKPIVMRFSCKGWMSVWTPSAWLMGNSTSEQTGAVREWRGCVPPYRELQTEVYLETLAEAVQAAVRRMDANGLQRQALLKAVTE